MKALNPTRRRAGLLWLAATGCMLAAVTGCPEPEAPGPSRYASQKVANEPQDVVKDDAAPPEDAGADAASAGYGAASVRHRVEKVLDDGELLMLEDGSVWNIVESDRLYSGGWAPRDEIVVIDQQSPPNYEIVNSTQRQRVRAVYRGTPK